MKRSSRTQSDADTRNMRNRIFLAAAATAVALAAIVGVTATHQPQDRLAVAAGSTTDPVAPPPVEEAVEVPADAPTTSTTAPTAHTSITAAPSTAAPAPATTTTQGPAVEPTTSTTSTTSTTTTTMPKPTTVELVRIEGTDTTGEVQSGEFTIETHAQQLTWSYTGAPTELRLCITGDLEHCGYGLDLPGPSGTLTLELRPARYFVAVPESQRFATFSATLTEVRS